MKEKFAHRRMHLYQYKAIRKTLVGFLAARFNRLDFELRNFCSTDLSVFCRLSWAVEYSLNYEYCHFFEINVQRDSLVISFSQLSQRSHTAVSKLSRSSFGDISELSLEALSKLPSSCLEVVKSSLNALPSLRATPASPQSFLKAAVTKSFYMPSWEQSKKHTRIQM